jgi:hypothetical protein
MILGATSPAGSLKLLWHYARNRNAKWTRTAWAVLLYLFVNTLGRFSIASLGFAYNLNEIPYTEYPVMVPDWSSEAWYNATADVDDYSSLSGTLSMYPKGYDIRLLDFD